MGASKIKKIELAKAKLAKILEKADNWGIRRSDLLLKLPSIKRKRGDVYFKFLVYFLVCFVGYHIVQGCLNLFIIGRSDEFCALAPPHFLSHIFRPPVNCDMCVNITRVEKLAKISSEQFENTYAYSGHPVIVTDATENWSAIEKFDFEFFKDIYEPRMATWSTFNCQFFPYLTDFQNLSEFFNLTRSKTTDWYVGWSNCDLDISEILRQHYNRPYFLPNNAEAKNIDWIFMGSPGYGAPIHVDNVEYPSWQAQLRGRKKWTLQPPPECYYECNQLEVIVEPGEIIVLDTNRWYHGTTIVSDEISVTIGAEFD